jgi:tetratricopeptide (TPR) repeat protein
VSAPEPQAHSLLGEPLYPRELSAESAAEMRDNLEAAEAALRSSPDDEDAIIWVGRRWGYLGEYRRAIEVFSEGLMQHPESYKLRRHRGHRYISIREFECAVEDLSTAAEGIRGVPDEVEPDGAPNAHNIPRSTSHSNIFYHLGLAHYLLGDFEAAAEVYQQGSKFCVNDDMLCANSYWRMLTLRRLGRDEQAQAVLSRIQEDMEILENTAYHSLLRLFQGEGDASKMLAGLDPAGLDYATTGYGVGMWYFLHDDASKAREIYQAAVEGPFWPAFGVIAAEAELARLD